jgi:hypothetical protein
MTKYLSLFFWMISRLCFAESSIVTEAIENQKGAFIENFGKKVIEIPGCSKFSLSLSQGQYIVLNLPEMIFYESENELPKKELPYLEQSPISHGYDWQFVNKGSKYTKWFGVMCGNIEDFSWDTDQDLTIEQELLMEFNQQKCPAKLVDGTWIKKDSVSYFKEIKGVNWTGVISAQYHAAAIASIKFCIIHNDHVMIGASENSPDRLSMPLTFIRTMENALMSIEFDD